MDFIARPGGDRRLAARYLRRAGFSEGRYDGPPITLVGSRGQPGPVSSLSGYYDYPFVHLDR